MTATTTKTAAPEVKKSAGDLAIEAAAKPGATNAQLLKAVWSTRGNVRAETKGFEFGVAIIKSDLTGMLKVLPADEPAAFILTPLKDGGAMLTAKADAAAE